jgi:hypothetical protein
MNDRKKKRKKMYFDKRSPLMNCKVENAFVYFMAIVVVVVGKKN